MIGAALKTPIYGKVMGSTTLAQVGSVYQQLQNGKQSAIAGAAQIPQVLLHLRLN